MSLEDQCKLRSFTRAISPPARRRRKALRRENVNCALTQLREQTPWERTPLHHEFASIRILKLSRGSSDAPIRCELQVVSLDNDPYYEVLSYVWGDCNITKPIHVDEVCFSATVNLFDFLHSLRLVSTDRLLWADAICINQKDEVEKSHQIGLMTRIYRQAKEAHVWFGPFDIRTWGREFDSDDEYTSLSKMTSEKWELYKREGSTALSYLLQQRGLKCLGKCELDEFAARCQENIFLQTLDILDEMAKGDHLFTYPVVALTDRNGSGHQQILNVSWLAVMDCIRWLITRPWWSRVWTLQEASLPRVDPTVHAPPYSFKLSRLLDGVESMWRHNNSICCKWFGQPVTTSNRDNREYGAAYTQCRAVHGKREVLAEAEEEGLGIPLAMVVNATQGRKATEIRDHWFGIFGFLPQEWQQQSQVFSTSCTTMELFSQFSNLLYLQSADLTELDKARRCKESLVENLPSWAIDLSNPRTQQDQDGHRWRLFSASGKSTYDRITEWPELRSPELSIKAIHVSSVQACARSILSTLCTPEDVRKLVNQQLSLYHGAALPHDADAFWRAVFMDRNVQTHWLAKKRGPLSSTRVNEIKQWWAAWNKTGDHRDLTFDRKAGGASRGGYHYKELQMNVEKTMFFVTSQGLPGMGPHDVQAGDEIYAVAGCKALVVLRPSSDERPTVVGLCFVDRWMYGRATQGGAEWKAMDIY
ncbi:hypothetical protein OPT61_g13 [Boeremia exigua]|uniref:Uncharacterized protein n=1 Tax=Boeremia exigua TaxID=749465 RepID=A0ACC2IV87_9PLEO|nr:hypothetical protein OPT61_g13 [Boeremia exigua]